MRFDRDEVAGLLSGKGGTDMSNRNVDTVTYSLRLCNNTSDEYYEKVSAFTDEVLVELNRTTGELVEDFQRHIEKNEWEDLRSLEEYELELLLLGILWKNYINYALVPGIKLKMFLTKLIALREKGTPLKVIIDPIKGLAGALFLLKEKKKVRSIERTLKNMKNLLGWLTVTGEFNQEVKRLKLWEKFLNNKSEEKVYQTITIAMHLAEWFECKSEEKLGCFTENVERFLEGAYKDHKWLEDNIYCGRKRVEYHLNMVGAEIMNRAFREDFLETSEKRLLLPSCMRFQSNKNCKAIKTREGYLCTQCTLNCKVSYFTRVGKKYDFKVLIIPHESSAFTKGKHENDKIGIVGVACVLHLISGGWKAKDLGFVPQCVLLDYCGCNKHWHEEGIITDINISQLFNILGITKTL